MVVNEQTIALLEHALDLRSRRHTVLLSNVANEETPGYQPKDLDFRSVLKRTAGVGTRLPMVATTSGHLGRPTGPMVQGTVVEVVADDQMTTMDGNRVNIEMEMAKIATNTGKYGAIAQILTRKFQMLQYAIREGR